MESPADRYLREHSNAAQDEALEWIARQTNIRTYCPQMLSGSIQGGLLKMLVSLTNAKRILEIGSFTGYSATCMALALPEDGHLDSLEINDELEDLIREGWERAGVADKISLHIGDAIDTLSQLQGPYDLVFIDANKREYISYYELVLPLLRQGGLIVADDVMQGGKVYEDKIPCDKQTQGLVEFNEMVCRDPRVEVVMLPFRDGLSLIRRK